MSVARAAATFASHRQSTRLLPRTRFALRRGQRTSFKTDMTPSARSRVPRAGHLASAVPAQQRRQQALDRCLDACTELGFFDEDEDLASRPGLHSHQVCQLVDASRKLSSLRSECDIRQDKRVYGILLRPDDLEAKAKNLGEAQQALETVIHSQERLVTFLQQPHSGPCLSVEGGQQQHVLNLLDFAMRDADLLGRGTKDLDWVMQFKEPSTVWTKLLHPTLQVTAAVSQCHEGLASLHAAIEKFSTTELGVR